MSLLALVVAGCWSANSLGAVSHSLVTALEEIFPRADLGDGGDIMGAVVLGGGEERLREAGQLARRYQHLRVVVTGAGEDADVLSLLGRGIDRDRVLIEKRARNTHENAVFTTAAVEPKPGERWLLVTSASHMPRAIGAFHRNGFYVEPWPVRDLDHVNPRPASVAQHEWLGLAAYWLLGRTTELIPVPIATDTRTGTAQTVSASSAPAAQWSTSRQP